MLIPIILLAVFLHFQILAIVVPIGLLCLYFLYKSKERSEREFILLLIIMGMTLAFFCDFAYINDIFGGDWERFNTVMKVYYQLWIFLSISAAYGVYYILHNLKTKKNVWLGIIKAGWVGLLVILIIAALIHPIATTVSMIGGRHATWWEGEIGTLDGFAFIESIDEGDYCAIQWLNDNIGGSPVILEMPGEQWSYSSRVSGYTGLPTVIGWQGNFEVVFGRDGGVVATRAKDVDLIYNTSDNDEAIELLNKYDVEYIYMGTLEKNKYSSEGLQKFDTYTNSYDLIYQNKGVAIYQLKED
jgi:YYY domain-containing protein